MYWRTVFEGPLGLDAITFSNEYAIAIFGSGRRGKPSFSSLRNSRAMVANSSSFHEGRSS